MPVKKETKETLQRYYLDFFDLWICWADAVAFLDFLVGFTSGSGSGSGSSSSSLESLSFSAGASSVSESSAADTSSDDDRL